MKASAILTAIRCYGGQVALAPDERTLLFRRVHERLREPLRREAYCVRALLREERACRAWEASAHDPDWWRTYNHNGARCVRP